MSEFMDQFLTMLVALRSHPPEYVEVIAGTCPFFIPAKEQPLVRVKFGA
jgi:hypothetical protein